MLLLASSVKLVAEIAVLAFIGQGVLAVLAGKKRDTNLFYKMLQAVTSPFVKVARILAPRVVLDRHVPIVALLLLCFIWLAATVAKISLCLESGVNVCR